MREEKGTNIGDKKEYEKVIENQLRIMIDFFGEQFGSSIEFEMQFNDDILNKFDLDNLAKIIYTDALKVDLPDIGLQRQFLRLFPC